jgi:hypothetical protein
LSFKKCALKAGISSEDMSEIRSHIQRAGNDAQGVQDYLDGIDADLNDLRNQTGTQLVTEQVTTPGQAITGEVVDMIRGLKPDVLNQAKAQGYEGDSPIESKEWLAAVKKFGPEGMTHEARMKRAEAMGFDTGTTYYHGTSRTPGEGITEFKSTKWDGVAGYFTEDPDFASVSAEFGPNPTVYPVYIRKGRALDLTSLGDSEGITHNEIIDKLKAEGVDFSESTVMDVPQHPISGGQPVWSYLARNDLINSIKNSGFDGIDFKEMGELDTQKLLDTGVESAKPTSNHVALKAENIRSINAAFDPDFKDSPLLLAQSQQVEPKNLFVAHNLSAENILAAADLGGLAAPSLAVARSDLSDFSGFGEVTLLADPSMLEDRKARTFDADVYTPRQPRATYDINLKKYQEFSNEIGEATKDLGLKTPDIGGLEESSGPDFMLRNDAVKYQWLKSIGKSPKIKQRKVDPIIKKAAKLGLDRWGLVEDPKFIKMVSDHYQKQVKEMEDYGRSEKYEGFYFNEDGSVKESKLRDMAESVSRYTKSSVDTGQIKHDIAKAFRSKKTVEAFEEFATEKFNSMTDGKTLFKGFTNSGNRRNVPYTMENVLKEMTAKLQGGEASFYGAPSVRSAYANEMKTIAAVQANRDKIIPEADLAVIKEDASAAFENALEDLKPFYKFDSSSWGYAEDVGTAIMEGRKALAETLNVTPEVKKIVDDLTEYLSALPTTYFETKVQRAVGFNEFNTAIVPKGLNEKALKILTDAGLTIKTYDPKKEDSRAAVIAKQNKMLFQEGQTEPQGQIAILPESAIIKLYNSANLSTFLHESGHLFLHMTGKLYSHPKASDRIKTDGVAILKYLGAESFDTITTKQHETWARGMEKYFGEGKAPSLELQGAFRRFSQWIKSVYTSLKFLNVELTDDIREVMDRMLATDEQIDRLKGNFKPIFKDAEDAEMTKAEFKAYDGNASPDAAKEELLKKLIKELRRKEEKWWKDEKFNIQTEVIKELEKTPVYSAEKYLREPESIPIVQAEAQAQIQVLEDAAADLYKKNDTVLTFVAKAGGLNRAEFKSQGIDEENFKTKSRVFGKPVFPKEGGLTADGVAEAYNEINNTNITANDAFELVQDSLSEDAFISGEVEAEYQQLLNDAQEIRFQYDGLGSNRLLTSEVKQIIPGRIPRRLAGMVSKFGSSAEQLAPMFGFASGSEMITSLAESKTIKQQSNDVAEAEMMGRHGDALHDGRIEEEAEQAMRNDSRAKKLLAELRSLSKKTRTQAIDRASLREYARAKIAKMKVNSISPSQFRAAEIRAARAAAVAKSKGDNDGAQKAKTQEIINFYLGKEAFLAKDKAEKIRSAHKVISNKSYDSNKINTEYVSKAKIILAAFDFRKTSRGTAEKHKAELEAARLWIESQQVDVEKGSPHLVQAEILGRLIPYYDMTVEDLTGLNDTITSLMKAGRETSIQKTEQFKAEMDELGDHINKNRIKEYNSDLDNSKSFSWGGKLYHGAAASLRTMGSLARQIDGMNEQGAFYQYVLKPLNDAANKELVMKKQSGLALREVFKGYDGVLGSTITGDTVISLKNKIKEKAGFNVADKMMTFRFDSGQVHRMSYGGRISVVLNMGNAGNYEALTNMNEFPITKRDLDQILNSLTDQDLDLIQNIWDYINTFWKEAAELEKSRSGVAPVKVEAQSFTTPKGRVMKGGYFPLVEDKGATAKTSDIEAQDARSRRGTAVANATKSGSLIERTKFGGRKISFNINNVFDHIDEIIHDLSHWQAVHDVSKVLENKRVKEEITKSVGVEGVVAINQRLAEVSAGAPKMEGLGSIERMFRHARLAVTYNALGFVLSTGLKNLAGFTVAAAEIGGGNLTVSLASFLESPSESTKFILKKSEYMSNRGEVINKDIAFARSQIRSDGKLDYLRSASFVFINLADQLVTRSTWLAAYSLAESKYDIKTEEARIDYADDVVRRTQGSGEALSQSNIMTRNEIMRVATIMYGPMNAMYNISAEQVFRYQAKRKKLGSKGEITAAEMVVNLMWTTVAGAIVMQLIQGIDADDDPKEKAKDLAWEIGGQIAGQVPFARDAYSAIKYGNSFDTPLGGMIKAPFEFGRQAWQGDMDKGMVRAVTGLASFWHIPVGVQLTKSWGYIYEMNDNEIDTFSPYELLVTGKE